jgi:uncharacterized protein (TIGR02145 family)
VKSTNDPLLVSVSLILASAACAKEGQKDTAVQLVSPAQVVRGSFIDKRDGTKYQTVKIGSQTWMAQNLNFKTDSSWCYDNDPTNCTKYGRLYTWNAAMHGCPEGWHLPTDTEWTIIEKAVGGKETGGTTLKSSSGWDNNGSGTDSYDFTVLPTGGRNDDGRFGRIRTGADFWSATERGGGFAFRRFSSGYADIGRGRGAKSNGFSVRCIQNDRRSP